MKKALRLARDAMFLDSRTEILAIALQNRISVTAPQPEFGLAGALLAMGPRAEAITDAPQPTPAGRSRIRRVLPALLQPRTVGPAHLVGLVGPASSTGRTAGPMRRTRPCRASLVFGSLGAYWGHIGARLSRDGLVQVRGGGAKTQVWLGDRF